MAGIGMKESRPIPRTAPRKCQCEQALEQVSNLHMHLERLPGNPCQAPVAE